MSGRAGWCHCHGVEGRHGGRCDGPGAAGAAVACRCVRGRLSALDKWARYGRRRASMDHFKRARGQGRDRMPSPSALGAKTTIGFSWRAGILPRESQEIGGHFPSQAKVSQAKTRSPIRRSPRHHPAKFAQTCSIRQRAYIPPSALNNNGHSPVSPSTTTSPRPPRHPRAFTL